MARGGFRMFTGRGAKNKEGTKCTQGAPQHKVVIFELKRLNFTTFCPLQGRPRGGPCPPPHPPLSPPMPIILLPAYYQETLFSLINVVAHFHDSASSLMIKIGPLHRLDARHC